MIEFLKGLLGSNNQFASGGLLLLIIGGLGVYLRVVPGGWRNRPSRRDVPLSAIQTDVLRLMAFYGFSLDPN